jgi:hypothetical protein
VYNVPVREGPVRERRQLNQRLESIAILPARSIMRSSTDNKVTHRAFPKCRLRMGSLISCIQQLCGHWAVL